MKKVNFLVLSKGSDVSYFHNTDVYLYCTRYNTVYSSECVIFVYSIMGTNEIIPRIGHFPRRHTLFEVICPDWQCQTVPSSITDMQMMQGWEFAHSLISIRSNERLWAIRSDGSGQMSNYEGIFRLLIMSKERPWGNCSGRSWQKSDCERFAQVDYDKWVNHFFLANRSFALSLTKKEQFDQKKLTKIVFFGTFLVHFL